METQTIEIQNQTDEEILEYINSLAKRRGRPKKIKVVEEPTEPKKIGRPKVEWRHGEDGKYNSQCIDPKYHLKYWRERYKKPCICEVCGKKLETCSPSSINVHKRSMHCKYAKLKKELEQQTINEL